MIKRDYLDPTPTAFRLANLIKVLLLTTTRTTKLITASLITGSDDTSAVLAVRSRDGAYQITVTRIAEEKSP